MACSCNNVKVSDKKPDTPCVFCAHKHAVTAYLLYTQSSDLSDKDTKPYAAGQLYMSYMHLRKLLPELGNAFLAAAMSVIRCENVEELISDLRFRCAEIADSEAEAENEKKITDLSIQQSKIMKELANPVKMPIPDAQSLEDAMLHVCAAYGMYTLEYGYTLNNKSYAIGELILAAWHLQHSTLSYAQKCRDCWLKMDALLPCHNELHALQSGLWLHMLYKRTEENKPTRG